MSIENDVMMQYFHWYTPYDGNLRKQLAENAKVLYIHVFLQMMFLPAFYKATHLKSKYFNISKGEGT